MAPHWLGRTVIVRASIILAVLAVVAAIGTLSALFWFRHAPAAPTATAPTQKPGPPSAAPSSATVPAQPGSLQADFDQLAKSLDAKVGVAVGPVGPGHEPTVLGSWGPGPAWSTIKVPLVIAAYRAQGQLTDSMRAAITESDNAAAESLFAGLGDPVTAAQRVTDILQQTGDPTKVESRKLRPEFTIFGQTIWSLKDQVTFVAGAYCDAQNAPVFDLMGKVVPEQSWGIGAIPGTQFKGGWGPDTSGHYLVRQIGVLTTAAGKVAVAIAAEPTSGSFADGKTDLDKITDWLRGRLDSLPAGQCPR